MIRRSGMVIFGAVVMTLGQGCKRRAPPTGAGAETEHVRPAADSAPGARSPAVVILGTSLTAGLGLDPDSAYPALLQQKIDSAGLYFHVVNAGVSGATSAGTRRQATWLLRREPPAMLAIETGANDGLRGLDADSLAANIQAIIDQARTLHPTPKLLLLGMEAPPNLGRTYDRNFRAVYRRLAAANHIPLVPFLLAGVAGVDSLNQADGIHPTAAGQRIVAATVWRALEPLLRDFPHAAPTTPSH